MNETIPAKVDIAKAYRHLINDRGEIIIDRAAVHITEMPDGEYRFDIYTDDGAGNGDHILSVLVEPKDIDT